MARKDDPVFNVKFVQLVESQACLWNTTHPGYSKKEEVQKAWQHVGNEIKDTVRNCRERWRTIRSSFLRSLKLARTQTGRGKRKYYLSKYLQFLIPYTKSRACLRQVGNNNPNGMVLRKPSTSTAAASFMANAAALTTQPMTRINHVNLMEHRREGDGGDDDNTKDSKASKGGDCEDSGAGIAEAGLPLDVQVSLQEEESVAPVSSPTATTCIPLRLHAIKIEQQPSSGNGNLIATQLQQHQHQHQHHPQSLITLPVSMAHALRSNMDWADLAEWLKSNSHGLAGSGGGTGGAGSGSNNVTLPPNHYAHLHNMNGRVATPPPAASTPTTAPAPALPTPPPPPPAPDADYSFLISLHPYLKEMSGKQNRRFRQKVVGLIDTVLDNADV